MKYITSKEELKRVKVDWLHNYLKNKDLDIATQIKIKNRIKNIES
jgi:hemerythrin